uniref:C2 domain-containing protein n=1 Tax=Amphiprion ocellaris TaxID=80972 RepID=A0AAQ6AFR6_AMPOC
MEDLMVSFASQIKKISTSHSDVHGHLLRVDKSQRRPHFHYSTQKSLSDTDISKSSNASNGSISTDCGLIENTAVAGELELALAYNTNTSNLEITVGTCRNLIHGDSKRRKCHPYVKLCVLPDKSYKLKTTVKRNTTDPVYNEVLKVKRQN